MGKAQEMLKELIDKGDIEALSSKENLEKTLNAMGCVQEEIEEVISEFKGFPLDDEDLMAVTGGGGSSHAAGQDPVKTVRY